MSLTSASSLEDRIDLWIADLRNLTPLPSTLREMIVDDEVQRARRFYFDADRLRFLVGRAVLRHALSTCLNVGPRDLRFGVAGNGKPYLLAPRSADIAFNLSHSGDQVIVGVSAGRSIGVDVEQVRSARDLPALAQICFTPGEREQIFREPRHATGRFYRYWACKEAWMKADGGGMSLGLQAHAIVSTTRDGCFRVESADGPLRWSGRAVEGIPGYACAVAADGGPWTVRMLQVDHMPTATGVSSRSVASTT